MSKKVTDLPAITSAASADVLMIVDDSDGLSKKITKAAIGVLTPTAIQTGVAAAAVGDLLLYDPTLGPYQIDAPGVPAVGDRFALKNVTIDATSVTIDGNGTNIEDPNTSTFVASFGLAAALVSLDYIYDGTNWIIL